MPEISSQLSAALADRYRIERELGAGGMATVYLAHDVKHNRKVALKVLKPDLAAVVGAERFLREIEVTANLQHPHILPLFESGEAEGFLFYVMPYVEGESLRGRIQRAGALPIADATRLMREVADALAYAHSRGVVHRDIKPDNVMVSGRHATVTDFGVARAVSEAAGREALTTVGIAVGTPAYMSPEQATADPDIDHRADIYAYGVLAYELLTGAPPFADRTPQQILAAHLTEEPKHLSEVRPEVGERLAHVVTRCLAKEPDDRWTNADEIVHRLETLATPDTGIQAVRGAARTRRLFGIAALAATVIIAVIGFAVFGRGSEPRATASSTSVAVFPFAVQGSPDVQYLGEGMVRLLSTSLDGAGNLRSVDPRAVIARVSREGPEAAAPEQAARVARDLGAGLFVLGDIMQVGERVRIDAALYNLELGPERVGSGSAVGSPDSILGMVDHVAAGVLASGVAGAGSRVTRMAAVTTSSLPALKLYLEGENAFGALQFERAVEAFTAAVVADSQFALALYRLSIAAEWALRPDIAREAAEGAVRHADRLSDHDRRLLEALLTARRGDGREAARLFRGIVGIWPQDVEGWFQLGEVQFHYGPLYGEPVAASSDAFQRVLAIEPDHATALLHMLRIAARQGDGEATDSFTDRFLRVNPEGDRALEAAILRAAIRLDSTEIAALRERVLDAPEVSVPQTTFSLAVWTDAFSAMRLLMGTAIDPSRSRELRALGHVHLAHVEALRGRWAAALAEFDAAESLERGLGFEHRALLMLQPFMPASRDQIEALRDTLRAWDAALAPPARFPTAHFGVHDNLHEGLRLYLLAMANVRLGDLSIALSLAGQLDRLSGEGDATLVHHGLAGGVRAAVAEARDDTAEAARILDTVEQIGNYETAMFSSFRTLAAERYRRAVLLDRLGRTDEAARLYRTFEDFNLYDRVFAAPSHLRAGRLAEREGRTAEARRHYERFLSLWANADSVFQPLIAEARAALSRLEGSDGS
jgi:serine/threonine-protein kinase